jgi:hypothetical protein
MSEKQGFEQVILSLETYNDLIEELADRRQELETLKSAITFEDTGERDEQGNALIIVDIDLDTIAPEIEAEARLQIFGEETLFGRKVRESAPGVKITAVRFTRQPEKRLLVGKARIIK